MNAEVNNSKFLERCEKSQCYKLVFKDIDFKNYNPKEPFDYFQNFWSIYLKFKEEFKNKNNKEINNTYNGMAFSIIMVNLIDFYKIQIEFMDEDIGIPDVKPDIVIKSNGNFLIFLSLKTSLRERWKQADWEAIKFKEKFKDGICYLLSNNEKEVTNIKKKDNLYIDKIFFTNKNDLNELVERILKY